MLTALRGGFGFLSRLPVGQDSDAWEAFRTTPVVFPLVGYVLGALLVLPFLLPAPAPTVALVFVVWVYLVTGINHLDGVADLGDALVVHGDPADRIAVMKDADVGVGGTLALVLVVVGLAFAAVSLAGVPETVIVLVIAAEVGAKLGMGLLACFGRAAHDGLGAAMTGESGPRDAVVPVLVSLPATALTWPQPYAAVTFAGSLLAVAVVFWLATRLLDGINGDGFGASNELARLVGLHAGVIAWMQL
jgi:adenosylcobinamide-GDP ribazoletransferase